MNLDLNKHLVKQIKFSKKTFGPASKGMGKGVIEHIREELEEIEDAGFNDLEEWIDVVILALDGAWRCAARANPKASAEELASMVTTMIEFKHKKNAKRTWPPWQEQDPDKAIGHIKEMPDNSALGALLTADPSELTDPYAYDVV
jgi:hypothetical protein